MNTSPTGARRAGWSAEATAAAMGRRGRPSRRLSAPPAEEQSLWVDDTSSVVTLSGAVRRRVVREATSWGYLSWQWMPPGRTASRSQSGMPCCGAEPAGAPAILTQRAARGKSGRLWRRSSRVCRRRLMSGNLSLPSGKVFSQQAERRGLARLAADATEFIGTKTHETSTNIGRARKQLVGGQRAA